MKNKKLLFIIILVVIIIIGIVLFLFFGNQKEDISNYKDSVVKILSYDEDYNLIGSGSGVAAISNDIILTNAHVLEDAESIEIITNDKIVLDVDGILYVNEDSDVAIIKLSTKHQLTLLKTNEKANVGDKIYAVGYSLGILNAISDGIVSSKEDMDEYGEVYSHTAPISSGNSGGALINEKGELIGINFASYDAGQNLNLTIEISNFKKAYENNKNEESIKFDAVSLSSTKYFKTENGRKILGIISGTSFDYLEYGIDEIDNISKFASHSYTIVGMNLKDEEKIGKLITLAVFDMNTGSAKIYDEFKNYVTETINYANYNIKGITLDYYWNCDNDFCYFVEYYKYNDSKKIIENVNNSKNIEVSKNVVEQKLETIISPSKVIQQAEDAKPEYVEKVVRGKTINSTTKDRLVVGSDIQAGKYNIIGLGSWQYVFVGAIEVKIPGSRLGFYLDPSLKSGCYYGEQQCDFMSMGEYYKQINNVTLEDGDIVYVNYPVYSSQRSSLKFEAISEDITHDAEPAKEEIIASEIKVTETIKKSNDRAYCYLNENLVNQCEILFNYNELIDLID